MADLYPVAGMKFYIGGVLASKATDFVAADFDTQVWVAVDGWETMGAVGDAVALISTPLINRGRDVKLKGTANAPSMQNNFAVLAADPGQVALIAAGVPSVKDNYAFKIEGNEGGTSPSELLFVGLVMGTPEQGGGANTARLMSATIEINSNIVSVAAVA